MRKTLFAFCISLITAFYSFGGITKDERKNWEKLDWMVRGTVPFKYSSGSVEINLKTWEEEINVSLAKNYSLQDSIEFHKIINTFNEAIPNRNIKWSGLEEPSLIISFTELNVSNIYQRNYAFNYNSYKKSTFDKGKSFLNHEFTFVKINDAQLYLHDEKEFQKRKKIMWNGFARILIDYGDNSGLSIEELSVLGGSKVSLTEFDKFFFKTIYADDFRKQYLSFIKSEYNLWEGYKFLTDERTKSSIGFFLYSLAALLLIYYAYKLFWENKLDLKLKSRFARFHILGLIFFIPQILLTVFYYVPEIHELQHWRMSFITVLIAALVVILFLLFFYFVYAFIAYLVECVVFGNLKEYKYQQYVRVCSMLVCMLFTILPFVYWDNISTDSPANVRIFSIFIAFLATTLGRLFYFHDQHQKSIIRQHQKLKVDQLEQLQTKFQLEAIQAKTNPHFLYNSLNTIASLAKQDASKTEDFALKLSQLLRLRLSSNTPSEIPLVKEIETIKLYLEIERERFFDRLEYEIDLPRNPDEIKIPSDILLNLVENSIKHGIGKQTGSGIIKIKVTDDESRIKLAVYDNGPNFPENPIYGTGLKSIMDKLDILYPDSYEFAIFNHPQKRIEISINK